MLSLSLASWALLGLGRKLKTAEARIAEKIFEIKGKHWYGENEGSKQEVPTRAKQNNDPRSITVILSSDGKTNKKNHRLLASLIVVW